MKTTGTNPQQQSAKQNETDQRYTESAMFRAFLPIFYSMKLVGLYHNKDVLRQSKSITSFGQLYSLTVICAMWAAVLTNLYPLKDTTGINPNLFGHLATESFYIQCSMNATCLFAAFFKQNALRKFFICLSNLDKYGGVLTEAYWFQKLCRIFCYAVWFLFVLCIAFSIYLLFVYSPNYLIPSNLVSGQIAIYLLQFVTALFIIYFTSSWLFTNCLLLLVSILINKECKLYRISLNNKLSLLGCSQITFENERKRFIEMTRVVKAADRSFSLRQATSFGLNIINICVLLYVISYYPKDIRDQNIYSTYLVWLVICSSDVIIACVSGILVTSGVSISNV